MKKIRRALFAAIVVVTAWLPISLHAAPRWTCLESGVCIDTDSLRITGRRYIDFYIKQNERASAVSMQVDCVARTVTVNDRGHDLAPRPFPRGQSDMSTLCSAIGK